MESTSAAIATATSSRRQGSAGARKSVVLAVALVVPMAALLGGCAERSQAEATAAADAAGHRTQRASPAPDFGKPTAAVDVGYSMPDDIAPGVSATLDVELVPRSPTERMEVRFNGIDGLIVEGGGEVAVSNPTLGTPVAHAVTVRADADGTYALAVLITTRTGDATLARAVSVPVTVGPPVATTRKNTAAVATDATGERIESMPAEETVVR